MMQHLSSCQLQSHGQAAGQGEEPGAEPGSRKQPRKSRIGVSGNCKLHGWQWERRTGVTDTRKKMEEGKEVVRGMIRPDSRLHVSHEVLHAACMHHASCTVGVGSFSLHAARVKRGHSQSGALVPFGGQAPAFVAAPSSIPGRSTGLTTDMLILSIAGGMYAHGCE